MPDLPVKYTKTIAILGRFRPNRAEDGNGIFTFETGSDEASAPLTAADIFATLEPELRLLDGAQIGVADTSLWGLELAPPEEEQSVSKISIGPDSVLLDHVSGMAQEDQETGGKLVVKMLGDVDVVARFSGTAFPNALIELARRYLNVEAEGRLEKNLLGSQTDTIFRDDPIATGRILQMLTAFDADVPAVRSALKTALLDSGFKAVEKDDEVAMLDAFVGTIDTLRNILAGKEEPDASWGKVVQDGSMRWVDDLGSSTEYNVDLGEVRPGVGGSLRDAYMLYREHADSLHKFVRAPSLHSYVFLWLMSKYHKIQNGNFGATAKVAYQRGVVGAGEKRVYGESPEITGERQGDAERAAREKLEKLQAARKKSGKHKGEEDIVDRIAEGLTAYITGVFVIDNRFTRHQLNKRLSQLFEDTVQKISGPIADVLKDSHAFIKTYGALYQNLVNLLNSGNDEHWKQATMLDRIAMAGTDEQKAVLDVAGKTAEAAFKDKKSKDADEAARRTRIRREVLDAFAEQVGTASMEYFVERYNKSEADIDQMNEGLRDIYSAAGMLSGRASTVTEANASASMPPAGARAKPSEAAKEKLRSAAKQEMTRANSAGKETAPFMPPPGMRDKLPEGAMFNGTLQTKDGKTIASVTGSRGSGIEAVISGEPDFIQDDKGLEGVTLVLSEDSPKIEGYEDKPLPLGELDPQQRIKARLVEEKEAREQIEKNAGLADKLGEYGQRREELRMAYARPSGALTDEALWEFQRQVRTLTLGEFIAAAPDAQSRIGKATVSETLKLLLDITEHLGELNNPALVLASPDDGTKVALGPDEPGKGASARLNLSEYFRLPRGDDTDQLGPNMIQNVMTYHTRMARSVNDVENFLKDLNDIRGIANATPTGTRILVINRTLDQYVTEARRNGGTMLTRDLHAATLFLTHAADAQGGGGWDEWAQELRDNVEDDNRDSGLSCPMIISATQIGQNGCPFPVADLNGLKWLEFRPRPDGQSKLEKGTIASSDHAFSDVEHGLVVDGASAILTLPAAMVAAQVATQDRLGGLSPDRTSSSFRRAFKDKSGGLAYEEEESVLSLLRRMWLSPTSTSCLAAMATARLATLLLMRKGGAGQFKEYVREVKIEPTQGEPDADAVAEARNTLYDAACMSGTSWPEYVLYVDEKTPLANADFNHQFAVTSDLAFRITVDGTTTIAPLDKAMREPFTFLNM